MAAVDPQKYEELQETPLTPATLKLLQFPDECRLAEHLQLSRSTNDGVRGSTLLALTNFSWSPELESAILARTTDRHPLHRKNALELAAGFRMISPAAFKKYEQLLRTEKEKDVLVATLRAVGAACETPHALRPIVLPILEHEDPDVARAALSALARGGAAPGSVKLFQERVAQYADLGLHALGRMQTPPKEIIPWLRTIAAQDDSEAVRVAAAFALGRCDDSETLLTASKSPDKATRGAAAYGLGGVRKPNAKVVTRQLALLKDEDADVRFYAASSVGLSAEPTDALLLALFRAFSDDSDNVRNQSRSALDFLLRDKRIPLEQALKVVDAELAKSPRENCLLLAKAKLVYAPAYKLVGKSENEAALAMISPAAKGLIQFVLKSDYQLAEKEKSDVYQLFYLAACGASKAGQTDLALKYLQASLEQGWPYMHVLKEDADLAPLRKLDGYRQLMKKYDR